MYTSAALISGMDVQTEGGWLYTVTGEAFTADGFAIYRLNGGYAQTYLPLTSHRSNERITPRMEPSGIVSNGNMCHKWGDSPFI